MQPFPNPARLRRTSNTSAHALDGWPVFSGSSRGPVVVPKPVDRNRGRSSPRADLARDQPGAQSAGVFQGTSQARTAGGTSKLDPPRYPLRRQSRVLALKLQDLRRLSLNTGASSDSGKYNTLELARKRLGFTLQKRLPRSIVFFR